MLASGLLPGAIELTRPGTGSNHIMPLFMGMPVSGSTTLEPKRESSVLVSATMLPSRSTTERCVVLVSAGMACPIVSNRSEKASRSASA